MSVLNQGQYFPDSRVISKDLANKYSICNTIDGEINYDRSFESLFNGLAIILAVIERK